MLRLNKQQSACVVDCLKSKGFVRISGMYKADGVAYPPAVIQPLINKKLFMVVTKSKTGMPLVVIYDRRHATVERIYNKLLN